MKSVKKLLTILASTALSIVALNAQNLSNSQRRNMNAQLLDLLDRYDSYSTFSETYAEYGFVKLFEKENSPVYCDYASNINFGAQIPASEYAKYSIEELGELYPPSARSIKKGEYEFVDGHWHIPLSFNRAISYIDEFGVYFSGDYELTLDCVYDSDDDTFLISSISGDNKSEQLYPEGHFNIVKKTQDKDLLVTEKGSPIGFNEFNQAIVKGNKFDFNDGDVVVKPKTVAQAPRYTLLELGYFPKKARLSLHFDYAPLSAYKVNSSIEFSKVQSKAMEAGLDLGYMFKLSRSTRFGFGIGVGCSMSELNLEVDNQSFSYELYDYGGSGNTFKSYIRHYDLAKVTEGVKFTDIVVPVYMSFEQGMGKWLNLVVDAGVKLYLNTKTEVVPYSIEGTVYNTYLNEKTPFYSADLVLEDGYLSPTSYKRKVYDLSFCLKGGFDIRFYKMNFLTLRVGYELGLTDSYVSQMNEWRSDADHTYPIFYTGGKDVMVRSFADCISYKRNALWFGVGYKLKF